MIKSKNKMKCKLCKKKIYALLSNTTLPCNELNEIYLEINRSLLCIVVSLLNIINKLWKQEKKVTFPVSGWVMQ